MARKLRMEFPGAVYHVINRGNYRGDIFATAGARGAFLKCLWAACEKSGWRLHAYVLMRNHFHLALETPRGNLVLGMQWLQATFANRFNRLRKAQGHLFQGRYKALLVEPGAALGRLCDYIHLNPVRAGVVTVAGLKDFRDSSYWQLWREADRPSCLDLHAALARAGKLADTPAGRRQYEKYLVWQAAHGPAGRNAAYVSLSQGWALGSEGFKERLVRELDPAATSRAWETLGKREIQLRQWQSALDAGLRRLQRQPEELARGPVAQPWKVALAVHLKEQTQASNGWLAERFGSPSPVYISKLVSEARHRPRLEPFREKLR